jgi:hypothetical protein
MEFCTGGDNPREPGTLCEDLSTFRSCPSVNYLEGKRTLPKSVDLLGLGSEVSVLSSSTPQVGEGQLQRPRSLLSMGLELLVFTVIHR